MCRYRMTLTNALIVLAITFVVSEAFDCSNILLTRDNNPYSFGSSPTNSSYNGAYNCTWKVYVPYNFYGYLTTNSMLASGDTVTIAYPGGSTAQLHNTHPQNTFWLPEGESQIQLLTKANGSLAFNLTWNADMQLSTFNLTVDPTFYPETFSIPQLVQYTISAYNSQPNGTLAIGLASQYVNTTSNNPHPLRSCFFYNGYGKNRTFITSFDTIGSNVQVYGNRVTMMCVSNASFDGYVVIQTAEAFNKYTNYQMAVLGDKPTNFTVSAPTGKYSALTIINDRVDEHTDITNLYFSTANTQISIVEGGINQPTNTTMTKTNTSVPYESRSFSNTYIVYNGDVTFSLQAHSNIPAAANCPYSQTLTIADSPYKFANSSNPIAYQGPFQCGWTLKVDTGYYVVLETSGSLSDDDTVAVLYPQSQEAIVIFNNHPNEKLFLPEGLSNIYFSPSDNGTFQMTFTWMKVPSRTQTNVPALSASSVVLMELDKLNTQSIYLSSDNNTMIGLSIAGAPINGSAVDHPFRSCFVMNQVNNTFLTTLDITLPSMWMFDPHVYIYCVTPMNYYSGYLVVANNRNIASPMCSVSYVTGSTQTSTVSPTSKIITVTSSPQMVTNILSITNTGSLFVADGSSSVNLTKISQNSTTFPYRTQGQVTIFTASTQVNMTFNGFTRYGSSIVASWILVFLMMLIQV